MQKIIVDIVKMGINGEGIAYIDKKPIFIPGAFLAEKCEIEITKQLPKYAYGKVIKIITKSPDRIRAKCEVIDLCGGCSLMKYKYDAQLKFKKQTLQESLWKYARIPSELVEDVRAAEHTYYYRNQCKLPVKYLKDTLKSGLYRPESNRLVYMDHCLVHDKKLDTIKNEVMRLLNKYRYRDYNEKIKKGIRYVVLRGFKDNYQLTLVTGKTVLNDEMLEEMIAISGLTSIFQNEQTARSHEIFGKQFTHLKGYKTIEVVINDIKLKLSPASFFQLNLEQASKMYTEVKNLLTPCNTLVEAYSGVGGISLLLHDVAKEVIGIEIIRDAVKNASNNCYLNHINNVKFVCGDAGEQMKKIAKAQGIDALVVDPPRTGLNDEMLVTIMKSLPKEIVYISCNPSTLAKDLSILQDRYAVKRIIPFDMFSHTPHVETLVLLTRK